MKTTASIRKKLLLYFFSIICVLTIANLVVVGFHFFIVRKYELTHSNIFNQYALIDLTNSLVADYNVYRNAPIETHAAAYYARKASIEGVIAELERNIVSIDSKTALVGVKNTIESVMYETDTGVHEVSEGNMSNLYGRFVEANRKLYFVRENTANLILKEIEYSVELSKTISELNKLFFLVGGASLLIVVLVTMIAAHIWADRLVLPLTRLSRLAGSITRGDVSANVDAELIKREDEIGSLALALDLMLARLKGQINKLNDSNEHIQESKHALEEKNEYLAKMNDFMIDREIAMVRLKKKVKILTDACMPNVEVEAKLHAVDNEVIVAAKNISV